MSVCGCSPLIATVPPYFDMALLPTRYGADALKPRGFDERDASALLAAITRYARCHAATP